MAELEIHHETHSNDPLRKKVGVLAAILAVLVAVVNIMGHRTHTEAIILRSELNDQWSFFQAKRMKQQNVELRSIVVGLVGEKNEATAESLEKYKSEIERYNKESEEIKQEADKLVAAGHHAEARALRFDIGEGLLEIGVVLSSLYFIARKKLLPLVGVTAGVAGIVIGAAGFLG